MITKLLSIHQLVYFMEAHSVLTLRNCRCIFINLVCFHSITRHRKKL